MQSSRRCYAGLAAAALAILTGYPLDANVASGERTVPVCMVTGSHALAVVNQAQTIAAGIFAHIGITIEWRDYHSGCELGHDQPILVHLSMHTDERDLPQALAYSLPFEGRHIRVFYDRVLKVAPGRVPCVLGYVLVHEITHILQGTDWHSDSGIMKRRWGVKDYAQMELGALFFLEVDIRLIRFGMEARAQQLASRKLGGEPASREVPVSLQSAERDVERLRGLVLGQAPEEAQFDNFRGPRVEHLQPR